MYWYFLLSFDKFLNNFFLYLIALLLLVCWPHPSSYIYYQTFMSIPNVRFLNTCPLVNENTDIQYLTLQFLSGFLVRTWLQLMLLLGEPGRRDVERCRLDAASLAVAGIHRGSVRCAGFEPFQHELGTAPVGDVSDERGRRGRRRGV